MTSVFISSTSKDLAEHRRVLLQHLHTAGYTPVAMEYFGSRSGDAESVSVGAVSDADVFVGIYAHRYGYCPDGEESVTEIEYQKAKYGDSNMPRLIFIVEDSYHHPLLEEHRETDPEGIAKLASFKRRLQKELVRSTFTTPEDLTAKVLASLAGCFSRNASDKDDKGNAADQSVSFSAKDVVAGVYGANNTVNGEITINQPGKER